MHWGYLTVPNGGFLTFLCSKFPKMWGFLRILAQVGIFNQNLLVTLETIHSSKITAENGLIF